MAEPIAGPYHLVPNKGDYGHKSMVPLLIRSAEAMLAVGTVIQDVYELQNPATGRLLAASRQLYDEAKIVKAALGKAPFNDESFAVWKRLKNIIEWIESDDEDAEQPL